MFWKKLKKKATEKHNYDLTYDNVAIPEVHTHKPEDHEETPGEDAPVHYDNVAIPEVHIRQEKIKGLRRIKSLRVPVLRSFSFPVIYFKCRLSSFP